MKDTFVPAAEHMAHRWYLVDADGKTLGRLASRIAHVLKGKNKPTYIWNADGGDYVVVINAGKVKMTGKKLTDKFYHKHSGFAGGMKETSYGDLMRKKPAFVIERAVWGMISHNALGRKIIKKLKVYAGDSHPHTAHKPERLEV
ncbi:MAG: 50S ribosomal protein L13 [Spirochaetota bacterium]